MTAPTHSQGQPDTATLFASGFDWQSRTRIVFGPGRLKTLGELALSLPVRHVLLVTDPGIMACGHAERARGFLESAGVRVTLFDRVQENPSTRCVDDCVAVARQAGIDGFVAVGGGSSMDTAKGCNFLLSNGGRMQDYWGIGKAVKPMLPLIAVPTTAGTGSECQSFALISDAETHAKMACGDPKAAARIALLDPELTLSQPARVTALTGIDAIAHAVESAATRKRNWFSSMCAREAFCRMAPNLPRVMENPEDLAARAQMQWGAALAGMAIESSMLGAAHSAANPLTMHFDVVHGHAVGLMLPAVVRYNARDPEIMEIYAGLARNAGIADAPTSVEQATSALVDYLESLLPLAKLPASLSDCGIVPAAIGKLADGAATQWTAQFNPRPIATGDFAALYASVAHRENSSPAL